VLIGEAGEFFEGLLNAVQRFSILENLVLRQQLEGLDHFLHAFFYFITLHFQTHGLFHPLRREGIRTRNSFIEDVFDLVRILFTLLQYRHSALQRLPVDLLALDVLYGTAEGMVDERTPIGSGTKLLR
jgi:hypothetical protein